MVFVNLSQNSLSNARFASIMTPSVTVLLSSAVGTCGARGLKTTLSTISPSGSYAGGAADPSCCANGVDGAVHFFDGVPNLGDIDSFNSFTQFSIFSSGEAGHLGLRWRVCAGGMV